MTGHENHFGMPAEDTPLEDEVKIESIQVSSNFQEQLKNAFHGYLSIKDALVNDDSVLAQKSASHLNEMLKKIDMALLTNNKSHNLWMPLIKELSKSSTEISKTTAIKSQRAQFITLSINFSKSLEIFGINKKIYKQFCPMVNSD